ncbi:hypothetical protein HQ865_09215 [Mucilaginibacter mali]|uniref:O-antigen ligase-like membrane protein n=1 Tax=Mucilaginibacter mali TaxID=2740462 RepID=A0A7D4Q2Y0_9SPHI|nr:hypothetical protein [Mucilaginibacter mali]QKJ29927.1 hypothetical protein HQ865_09215 [Mucilaginibacter mali]
MIKQAIIQLKKVTGDIDWKLLILLVLFLNVKLAIKLLALIIVYCVRPNFRFGFHFKNSRLPLFYVAIIALALTTFILNKNFHSTHYTAVLLTGIGFWTLCIFAAHQVKLSVEQSSIDTLHRTIFIFFVLNLLFTLGNIVAIVIETGALNPYRYQGNYQKYFISTGDYIKGLTFDTSTTNAVLNAFGVIYFLLRRRFALVCLCMAGLLLTASNFVNIVLLLTLGGLFAFNSDKDQKSIIIVCVGFLLIFLGKISPQNSNYVGETFGKIFHQKQLPNIRPQTQIPLLQRADSTLNPDERKRRTAMLYLDSLANYKKKPLVLTKNTSAMAIPDSMIAKQELSIPKPSIHSAPFQNRADTTIEQKRLLTFINTNENKLKLPGKIIPVKLQPGKLIAMQQTLTFLEHSPAKIIWGDGMGNFSSKLAFRVSNLGIAGGFPASYTYISNEFLTNHLKVYLNYFSRRANLHSLTNSPNSVYDQLLSEYGILGFILFIVLYIGYFVRSIKYFTYGIPLLLMTGAIFFVDYWFEQLSVVILFELLMFLNIKENSTDNLSPAHAN